MKQIKINEKDNVAVMLEGELSGHKIALNDIKKGENIIKYGYPIGHATEDIKKDDHVHTHNIKTNYRKRKNALLWVTDVQTAKSV